MDRTITVYFFKSSGKYYTTEEIPWTGDDENYLPDEFAKVLKNHLMDESGKIRLSEMWAICIEPFHKHSYPQMMKVSNLVKQ